jgi:type I restriction enzyme S subunit
VTRLKAYATNPVDRPPAGEALPFFALEHVESGTGQLLSNAEIEPKEDDTSVLHRPGDVRFGKLRPYLAKSLLMSDHGCGSGELLVLRPRPCVVPRYLHYVTLSKRFTDWATATSYGVKMPRTNWESLAAFDCRFPAFEDQLRLSDVLDSEITRIDDLIGEQKCLIDLLIERRTAELDGWIEHGGRVVDLAATSSRWVDAIPGDWAFMPLKRCVARVMVGIVINPSAYYEEVGVPVLRGLNIRPGGVSNDDLVYMSAASNELHRKSILCKGDVVVVRTGAAGSAAVVPEWAVGGNAVDLLIVRPGERLLPAFLEHLLNSRLVQQQVLYGSVGALQSHFNTSALANLMVVVPPIAEQERVLDHLGPALCRYDELIAEASRQIELLRQHRQALITDAVTGGLDALDHVA